MVPDDDERTTILGIPVTTLSRTLVDCASSLSPMGGLVIADAALRAGVDRTEVDALIDRRRGRRGIARARAVIALADAGAESPGESVARYLVLRDGLPVPTTQIPIATRLGTFWADLGWEAWRIALEYDGRPKYTDGDREVLVREKRRHDAMTEAGWRVLRVTKEDLGVGTLSGRVMRHLPSEVAAHIHPRRALHP
jgi:hypothetical protein